MDPHTDILKQVADLRSAGEAFALATVVRTVAATAAKAGAKAIGARRRVDHARVDRRGLRPRRGAEGRARGHRRRAIEADLGAAGGHARRAGVSPGSEREGVRFARNMCPSKGTMDIFVEPMLPSPAIVILGASPVAVALADAAPRFGFHVTVCAPAQDQGAFASADTRIEGFMVDAQESREKYIVVSTQGRGDEAALRAALSVPAAHVAFVGSRAKAATIAEKLRGDGVGEERLAALKAPAGLDIGAITPEEIALSILAEIVQLRRASQRSPGGASQ